MIWSFKMLPSKHGHILRWLAFSEFVLAKKMYPTLIKSLFEKTMWNICLIFFIIDQNTVDFLRYVFIWDFIRKLFWTLFWTSGNTQTKENMYFDFHLFSGWGTFQGIKSSPKAVFLTSLQKVTYKPKIIFEGFDWY